MPLEPAVSIILPVFNDESTIEAALESCLAQTLTNIEVICVDDASTDGTGEILAVYADRDDRIRVITHTSNLTAFPARRSGVLAARAAYVLFLDGDDELSPDAASKAFSAAQAADADLVGFGVTIVERDGSTGGAYERRLQPRHGALAGDDVLRGLFPVGAPARGQLWRHLFRTSVLCSVYEQLPEDLTLPRVNDLPLMFLAASLAERYVTIPDRLYRYHFGRGGSGHRVDSVERAIFYISAVQSIDSIGPVVARLAAERAHPEVLRECYASARLSIIGYVCSQLIDLSDGGIIDEGLAHLRTLASDQDIIEAAVEFYPRTLSTLRFHTEWRGLTEDAVKSILLVTSTLRTGGVTSVLTAQARHFVDMGFRVIVVARNAGSDVELVPDGASFIELAGEHLPQKLAHWAEICRTHHVDIVIDHQVLYTPHWPEFALVARATGAATIGWLHNFAARPIYNGTDRLSLIERSSATLALLVVLSPLDVSYFKLRGIRHTVHLPNPPSQLLLDSVDCPTRSSPIGRIELVWWGRLEQRTKKVRDLIELGAQLKRMKVDFRLTIIGPEWDDLTPKKLNAEARRRRVAGTIRAVGALRGRALREAIDSADIFVSTSIIEGYQLTIAEAQARGLPVVMYDLPWLPLVQDNDGVMTVPQGDVRALARRVADLGRDPKRYVNMSRASVVAAGRARTYDFDALYRALITGRLPEEYSPEPTLKDAELLLGLFVFFAENSGRRSADRGRDGANLGARAWRAMAPKGRAALAVLPGLRPLAHRAKTWLRAN
jgi:glycosyltransferase involved in cell wall biosynthesis